VGGGVTIDASVSDSVLLITVDDATKTLTVTKDGQVIDTTSDVWVVRTSPDGGSLLRFNWNAFGSVDSQAGLDERSIKILQLFVGWKLATKKAHTIRNLLEQCIASNAGIRGSRCRSGENRTG